MIKYYHFDSFCFLPLWKISFDKLWYFLDVALESNSFVVLCIILIKWLLYNHTPFQFIWHFIYSMVQVFHVTSHRTAWILHFDWLPHVWTALNRIPLCAQFMHGKQNNSSEILKRASLSQKVYSIFRLSR